MAIYKDISLDFGNLNIYNDIPVLTDRESIINTFKNNLFIDPDELYFNNQNHISIKSLLHTDMDAGDQEFLDEAIRKAAQKDPRINKILDYSIEFNRSQYELIIKMYVRLNIIINTNGDTDIDFRLVVSRSS